MQIYFSVLPSFSFESSFKTLTGLNDETVLSGLSGETILRGLTGDNMADN